LILGAIVVVVIIASAIIAGFNPGGLTGFSIFGTAGPTKNIMISTSLNLENLEFTAPAEILTIETYSQEKQATIGDQNIDLTSYATIELENFNGRVTIKNKRATISGQADKASVNDVSFSHKSGTVSFNLDQVEYAFIIGEEIILPPMKYEKADGYIDISNNKFYVQLNEEPLELGAFKGILELTESDLNLEGIVDKVFVNGESKFLVDE